MLPSRAHTSKHSGPESEGLFEAQEDTQGKQKDQQPRARKALAWTAFFVAACLAFAASQLAYVLYRRLNLRCPPCGPDLDVLASMPLSQGPPRSELEKALRHSSPVGASGRAGPEVLIALCTMSLVKEGMFQIFIDMLLQSGLANYLIVGLDKEIYAHLLTKGINVYYHEIGDTAVYNHAISAKKFRILESILELGWSVLLSDIDVVILKNPFDNLYRDHDIEALSDGFDDASAFGGIYGLSDPSMGWAQYAQGMQHLNLNSGLFYVKANARTLDLMDKVAAVLEADPGQWDQAMLNQQLFTLSHGDFVNPGCTVRVMEREKFMNSKVLFKEFRHKTLEDITGANAPVMIHMNYHPNKMQRMVGAIDFFVRGNYTALAEFPGGSESGS